MAEYSSLLSDLSENITTEDLRQLKSACKEDIPEGESGHIACSRDWFTYLEERSKLAKDNLLYIEHIFEISPEARPADPGHRISEDNEVDTKLTRIPSAKKYKDATGTPSYQEKYFRSRYLLPIGVQGVVRNYKVYTTQDDKETE
ncbi:hypothetical protein NHX12_013814, partial [Muraenolepis orangiensis]